VTADVAVEAVAVEAVAVESVALVQSATTSHAEPDMEQIYAEEEKVVIHDFSDDLEPSEVMVNLDDLAEPVSESMVFAPTEVTDLGEPELFPAQALELGAEQGMEELALASQGFQAMANSMWDEAAVCFQQLAKKHPTDARIMNNYGLALLQRAISMQDDDHFSLIDGADTQFEAAIMALRQAAHSDPGEVTVLFNLGNALAGSGRYDKALRIFNAFLERSPPTSGALNGRAAAYIGLGRFDEATRDLNDAVSRFGDHPVLLSNLRLLAPA
jgi:tetratricopeptide (TPR) repeat protein